MRAALLLASIIMVPAFAFVENASSAYEKTILQGRLAEEREVTSPDGWFSLVALEPLTDGDVSVGSAPGNTLHLEHGLPHAFTLRSAAGRATVVTAADGVALDARQAKVGDVLTATEGKSGVLKWGDQFGYIIHRTGNQTYLRIGDHHSSNLTGFHGLKFYPVKPTYRIVAKWVPYYPPHELRLGTVLGTTLVVPSPGYAEFVIDGQTVRLDATGGEDVLSFSFRDGTYKTTTYGAGRHVPAERPSNGLNQPGTVVIDFNRAANWPCAYTQYGTCPLPPAQNRFNALIPAGEKRYHD